METKRKKRNKFRVVERNLSKQLGLVFKLMYRRGITDADYHSDDMGKIEEHISQTSYAERFGYLDHPTNNWLYWRNRLSDALVEERRTYRVMEKYWDDMKRFGSNYMSVALVLAQDFYNLGLRDYLTDPYRRNLARFNQGNVRGWLDGRLIDNYRLRNMVQDICITHMERIENGETDPLERNHYEVFMTSFSFAIVAK